MTEATNDSMVFDGLEIAQVAQVWSIDEIWTSDKFKPERGIWHLSPIAGVNSDMYVRADGTYELFSWDVSNYPEIGRDHVWRRLGTVQRDSIGEVIQKSIIDIFNAA